MHKLAVATLVFNDKKEILLVRNYRRGWEFPGGYVEHGETLKKAAVREVKEESGIDIQLTRFFGLDQIVKNSTLVVIFEGKQIAGVLTQSNENLEIGFFPADAAQKMITLAIFKDRVNSCLMQKDHPFINEIS